MRTLKKLARSACFALMLAMSGTAAAANYQDWWWNPSIVGAGINIGQQGNTIAAAWYLFDADGHPTFLTFAGQLVGNQVSGNLFRTEVSGGVATNSVGSATFTFTDDNTATLSYTLFGQPGSIALNRFTYASPAIGGIWDYSFKSTVTGCTIPSNNGTYVDGAYASINLDNNHLSMTTYDESGGICVYNITINQTGSIANGQGSFSCNFGISGTASFASLRVADDFITLDYTRKATQGETCQEIGKLGGVRL